MTPLRIQLEEELEEEKEHSLFLEKLLKALYGEGWEKLTISKAKEIYTQKIKEEPRLELELEEEYGKGRWDLNKNRIFRLRVSWWRRLFKQVRCPRCSTRMKVVVDWSAWRCLVCDAVIIYYPFYRKRRKK